MQAEAIETTIEPSELVAIAKASEKGAKAGRSDLDVGIHAVDVTVRVHGSLDVRGDETYTPTVSVPLKAVLALFTRYCGITREAAHAALLQSMTEVLLMGQQGEATEAAILEQISEAQAIDDCLDRVTKTLKAMPLKTRKGKVLSRLTMERV